MWHKTTEMDLVLETVTETVASDRDKWRSKTQSIGVYAAPLRAQHSHLQRLNTPALFWVSLIRGKLPAQTAQICPLPR